MTLWVLITNSSFAEIFEVQKNGKEITKIHHIDFPMGREKGRDIFTDRSGRSFDSSGTRRHALNTEKDLHTHEQQVFAHKLADFLHKALSENQFEQLSLIAPPQFLGELRQELSKNVKEVVVKEVNKDIPEGISTTEKIAIFCRYLDIPQVAYARK